MPLLQGDGLNWSRKLLIGEIMNPQIGQTRLWKPRFSRRNLLWAGLISLLGLGLGALLTISNLAVDAQPINRQASSSNIFQAAFIGDLPYNPTEVAQFQKLITDVNRSQVAFVVHDGDLKSGSSPCSDAVLQERRSLFQGFSAPFVFIFGDNEWTDCHRPAAGNYDPIERLAMLRRVFATTPPSGLTVTRQSEQPAFQRYPENLRWRYGQILFVGLHLTGSNNNLGRTPAGDAEYGDRNQANLTWLREGYQLARQPEIDGLVIIIHANPGFELKPDNPRRTGFNDFLTTLTEETIALEKPILLVHGDTHYFQIDKPLVNPATKQRLTQLTRLETFGSPDVHWVLATFDPSDPNLFRLEPRLISHLGRSALKNQKVVP